MNNRRAAHDTGRPRWRQGAQPRRQVSGLAAGGRRPFGTPSWFLPARTRSLSRAVPTAGPGLRPGPVSAGRARIRAANRAPPRQAPPPRTAGRGGGQLHARPPRIDTLSQRSLSR